MDELLKSLDVLILCGGRGTRIAPHIPPGTPKCMADIGGTPFIDILLRKLAGDGLRNVTLLAGHACDRIDLERWPGVRMIADQPEGTIAAVMRSLFGNKGSSPNWSDPFVVVNGDTYWTGNYGKAVRWCLAAWKPLARVRGRGHDIGLYLIRRNALWRAVEIANKGAESSRYRNLDELLALRSSERLVGDVEVVDPYYDIGTHDGLRAFRGFARTQSCRIFRP